MAFHNHSLSIYCEGVLLIRAGSVPLSVCWGKQHVPGRRNLREADKLTPTQLEKTRKNCRVGHGHYSAVFGNWSLAIETQVRKLAQGTLFKLNHLPSSLSCRIASLCTVNDPEEPYETQSIGSTNSSLWSLASIQRICQARLPTFQVFLGLPGSAF